MIDLLKDLILTSQEIPFPVAHKRCLKVVAMPQKATICVGVRRCGKSTFMQQIMKELMDAGISRENMVHLNFSDERLFVLLQSDSLPVDEAYYQLFPEKKYREKVYFFFDEIQLFPHWALFIDRLMRNENCEVYLTGSSAKLLSTEIATEMRGRSLSWEMFPFSFGEYVQSKGVENTPRITPSQRLFVQQYWDEYMKRGGFPEVLFSRHDGEEEKAMRVRILQEYFRSILLCDVMERHKGSDSEQLRRLAHKLINQMGCLFSVNKLFNDLKSQKVKTSHTSVSEYLSWFEDAYFFFFVPVFDASFGERDKSPRKAYVIDHAFAAALGSGILPNRGLVLENIIFLALRRLTKRLYYYRSENGRHDADFVAIGEDSSQRILVQVCESIAVADTRKREVSALLHAMRSPGLTQTQSFIVTQNERETITGEDGDIAVLPAWDFLLRLERREIAL
ncbi:MAG: ATP-binding protein [Akkermansia sp.]